MKLPYFLTVFGVLMSSPLAMAAQEPDAGRPNEPSVVSSIVVPEIARGHEEFYRLFINGKLIYKKGQPDQVELPFSGLSNLLAGTFDLSPCGDAAKHLSISTGYCRADNPANADKVEICIMPRFLIEKSLARECPLDSTARECPFDLGMFLAEVEWPAQYGPGPLGLFFTQGNKSEFSYLLSYFPKVMNPVNSNFTLQNAHHMSFFMRGRRESERTELQFFPDKKPLPDTKLYWMNCFSCKFDRA
jgi:hypothetical protein